MKPVSARLFHMTTWDPASLAPGTIISTGNWTESAYWVSQQNVETLAKTMEPELSTAVESARAALAGSRVKLEADVPAMALGKARAQKAKEETFERIRAEEFPGLPSRRSCIFGCETLAQLTNYASTHGFTSLGRSFIELELLGPAPGQNAELVCAGPLRVNPQFLACNSASPAQVEERARRYWRQEETSEGQLTEVLFEGFFQIVRVLHSAGPAAVKA